MYDTSLELSAIRRFSWNIMPYLFLFFWKSSKIWNCRLLQIIDGSLRVNTNGVFHKVWSSHVWMEGCPSVAFLPFFCELSRKCELHFCELNAIFPKYCSNFTNFGLVSIDFVLCTVVRLFTSKYPQVEINKKFQPKIVNIFLSINFNKCFGYSKELSHWDGSFEYPQHMFWLRTKKIKFSLLTLC